MAWSRHERGADRCRTLLSAIAVNHVLAVRSARQAGGPSPAILMNLGVDSGSELGGTRTCELLACKTTLRLLLSHSLRRASKGLDGAGLVFLNIENC
jgi:hypothetical protein